jgi:hypothetical protein
MIKHLFLMALILIAINVSTAAAATSGVNIAATALAQNVTSETQQVKIRPKA